MLTADAMASPDKSMAPRSDSSASRLWGGTRPTRCCRRRVSSIDWTMGVAHHHPCGLWVARPTSSGFRWGSAVDSLLAVHSRSNTFSILPHRALLGHNLHIEPHLDVGVQPKRHLVGPEGP